MSRKYADFDLVFHRDRAGSYTAEVSNSPVGEAVTDFEVPFSDQDLEIFLLRMGQVRRTIRRIDSPELEATRQFGSRLYEAAFRGRVGTLLERSLDEAERNEQGLRVRLHLAETPELADLPWEFVYSEALGRFLAVSTHTPLVRYLDLPRRVRPLTISPPLRILVMISSPADHTELDVTGEWRRLESAFRDLTERGLVQLSKVQDGSLPTLQKHLRTSDFHVLHYIGHGAFDETRDDGVLILEDARGRGHRVGGEDFGMMLHDHRALRLVVLNACEGARSSRTDPFSGTGKSLIQQGIPAVVAMQFEISDEAAIDFAREFYGALADGYPVDAAMGEARKALFQSGVEWGTPVLYLRAPDGRIFDVEAPAQPPDATEPPPRRTLDAGRLAHLLDMARTSVDGQDWTTAVSRLEDIIRLDPGHSEAHELLGTARAQEKIARMYGGARLVFEAKQWRAVLDRIEQIRLSDPDFDDPEQYERRARRALAEEERAGRLAGWYREATVAVGAGEWDRSIELLERVLAEAPDDEGAGQLLAESRARLQSDQLLIEACEAIDAERWQAALDRFDEMESLGPGGWQDPHGWRELATERLADQQQTDRLDTLYDTAVVLIEGEGWDEASRILDQIESERPGYRGIDVFRTRITAAQAQLAEEERAGRLAGWYREATVAAGGGEWDRSVELLERVIAEAPDYEGAAQLLDESRARLQSDRLLVEAGEAIDAERWQAALDRLDEMESLGAGGWQDPHGWRELATERLAEQQKTDRLDALYDAALVLIEGEGWDEASRILDQIERERPGYRGIDGFRARIRAAHAQLVEEERLRETEREPTSAPLPAQRWPRPPTKVVVTAGAVGLLMALAFFVFPRWLGDRDETTTGRVADTPPDQSTVVEPFMTAVVGVDEAPTWLTLDEGGGDVDVKVVAFDDMEGRAWRTGNGLVLPSPEPNEVPDFYMQFKVADDVMYQGSPTTLVTIEVEYLDEGFDTFRINYDSSFSRGFKETELITKTNTGEFKTADFVLSDAYFGNRTNGGDFRIADNFDGAETIRRVTVTIATAPPGD